MDMIDVLKEASKRIYEDVKGLAGTPAAAGDFGVGAGGDISRNIDITAEASVLDFLREMKFDGIVLGEECGPVQFVIEPKGCIIMDAIDGSANAVRGLPFFCSSLAYATGDTLGSITDAVVTDLSNGDMYWATRNRGAYLNGVKISTYEYNPIYRIVGVNTSGATPELMRQMDSIFINNHTRHLGANALEMATLAKGSMDVFIDLREKIRVHDIAAGYLIINEAGGIILDKELDTLDATISYDTRISFIAAANQKILDEVMSDMR